MNWRLVIWSTLSLGVGAVGGYFVGKKREEVYWKKRLEDEMRSYNGEVRKQDKEIVKLKEDLNRIYGLGIFNNDNEDEIEEPVKKSKERELSEDVERARRAALRNWEVTEQYQKYAEMYQKTDEWEGAPIHNMPGGIDPAEEEHPIEEADYEDLLVEEEERQRRLQTQEKPCVIITPEEMGDLPGHTDTIVLLYYKDSDILTEEDGTLIDNPELLIGDCLEESGFRETTQDFLQVWNQEHRTIYEISKVPISYVEED